MTPDPWCEATGRHGDYRSYHGGCRCTGARRAVAAYNKRRYHERQELGPGYIPCTGTQRRIRALVANGWRMADIAAAMHWPMSFVGTLATNSRPVWRVTAARVAAFYDEQECVPGPSPLAAARARNKGWATPDQWTTDIDDPKSKPVPVDHVPGYHARAVPLEDVELLVMGGETWERCCTRLGVPKVVLDRRLRRNGRLDLIRRLTANSEVGALMALRESGAYGARWSA